EHLFLTRKTTSNYPYTADGKMNHALDYAYPDVWSSFAAMAAVTTRLHFSSSVYLLPLRSPIEVAKQAGTCALISDNRVTIGPGHTIEEAPALVAELNRLRREAGREHLPFEVIVPILPLDPSRGADAYKRLEDLGVTATFLPPFDAGGVDRGRSAGLGRRSS